MAQASQAPNRSNAFEHHSGMGHNTSQLPTQSERRLARAVNELRRVRRVSWYGHSQAIAVQTAHGTGVDRFLLSDIRELVDQYGVPGQGVTHDEERGTVFIQNRNRNDNRL